MPVLQLVRNPAFVQLQLRRQRVACLLSKATHDEVIEFEGENWTKNELENFYTNIGNAVSSLLSRSIGRTACAG